MSRREFLKTVGLAGIIGATAASAVRLVPEPGPDPVPEPTETPAPPKRTPAPDEETIADQYETVVDVAEVGADPAGTEPVESVIVEHAADDTLLSFPAGTYRMNPWSVSGLSHFGMRGPRDGRATLVPTTGDCRGGFPYVHFDGLTDFLVQDVEFDFTQSDAGGPIHFYLHGDNTVRNVRMNGSCSNQISVARVDVRDESGSALFRNVHALNGEHNKTLTGIYVGGDHAGEVTFEDCEVHGFSDNGLYASAPGTPAGKDGTVHAVGGTFANNNIANVRLGSTGSTASGVTVQVDTKPPGWNQLNARGIRLRWKQDQVIEDCDITFAAGAARSFGAIVFHPGNRGALVRNTQITIERDEIPAIRAFAPSNPGDPSPIFEGLEVRGGASGGYVASIHGRDGTVIRDCDIRQTGANRSGIHFFDSKGCRIVDSRVEVATEPITLHNAAVRLENTTIVTPGGERTVENEAFQNEVVSP